jgi:quercetin dioxygenase-like cupin family protein
MLRPMSCTHFEFASAPFVPGGHPLEQKKVCAERPVGLLRFAPGFADPNWCERAHVIYVLSGVLELELREGTQRVAAGNGCWLDAGTPHRASNPGSQPADMIIVSDVALVTAAAAPATSPPAPEAPR